jgi:hypothetical protein
MGTCVYCGEPAGWFRSRHAACVEKHQIAAQKIPGFFVQCLTSNLPAARFRELAEEIARTHHVGKDEFRQLAVKGISDLIDAALADHMITVAEEQRIDELREEFGLSGAALGAVAHKLVKAEILRDLDYGRIPRRVNLEGECPINLQRGERIIWIFNGVSYQTVRSRTQYVGASHGVSLRIMKGVYYRVGAHKGERVQTPYLSEEGRGDLAVTDRAVYFLSPGKVVKIPATKIVSIKPYSDGIEIIRDAATAKPQFFLLDDAWFAANLISRLNRIEE